MLGSAPDEACCQLPTNVFQPTLQVPIVTGRASGHQGTPTNTSPTIASQFEWSYVFMTYVVMPVMFCQIKLYLNCHTSHAL